MNYPFSTLQTRSQWLQVECSLQSRGGHCWHPSTSKKMTWIFPPMHRWLSHAFFKELQVLSKCFGVVFCFVFCSFVRLRKLHLIFVARLKSLCWPRRVGGAELRMTQAPNSIYKICVCVSQSPDRDSSVRLHPNTHSTNRNWSWRDTLEMNKG